MKRVIFYLLTSVIIICGMTSNIFANQLAKESSIPFIMQPGTVLIYDDSLNPVILEGGYIDKECNTSDDKFKIYPGMKLVYDENTGDLNNIYYVDKSEPSGYSIHQPGILITSADNTEAIELFKRELPNRGYMLARNGFGESSEIGTPFSVAYQYEDSDEFYLFYFPIINSGKIVSYIEQTVSDNGFVSWAITKFFDGESDLEQLRGYNAYALIRNNDVNLIAYSNEGAIPLEMENSDTIKYTVPYRNVETTVVDITKSIDVDTSFVIPQTDEEKAVFEYAQNNGKFIATLSIADNKIINRDNRVFVPIRELTEIIGCEVGWNENTKTAYLKNDGITACFTVNSKQYTVNGETHSLDVPVEINNGKMYIPLRQTAEALGLIVVYNSNSKAVTLSKK